MNQNYITLYPSNWLYNAGVIGFLELLNDHDELSENKNSLNIFKLPSSGEVKIPLKIFENLDVDKIFFDEKKLVSIIGKNKYYKNYLQSNQKELFKEFVHSFKNGFESGDCQLCNNGKYLKQDEIERLKSFDPSENKFLDRIQNFNMVHSSNLGPSIGEFPNGFWNCRQSTKICHVCSFIIIHQHLALHQLPDRSEIFINAPSFQLMYYLNKFIAQTFSAKNSIDTQQKRTILAMSVIEYSIKTKATIGIWASMNIEIVSKHVLKRDNKWSEKIEFYSIPSETIQLISDRQITEVLSDIGEFKILNLVLNQDYSRLVETGYRLLRESMLDFEKQNKKLIDDWLFLYKNKGVNLYRTANKIFNLYALIEKKIKRSQKYGRTSEVTFSNRATF